jgi:hypothetical protein
MSNVTERAMMVNLSISQWTAVKNDRKVTREVADAHGSQEDMGKFAKSLVAKETLEDIRRIASTARLAHYKRTLPWKDGGDRLLSSAGYFAYGEEMRELQTAFGQAVDKFCTGYDAAREDARIKLNGLFDESDYPATSDIRSKFALVFDVSPMPDSADFRVDLGAEETARIKSQIESDSRAMLDKAMRSVWERMADVIGHMTDRLKAYQELPGGKVQSPFRDSLVSNVVELLDILPTLNITEDARIKQFAADIRANLVQYSPAQLRESETLRADVASRADEILSKMSNFLG